MNESTTRRRRRAAPGSRWKPRRVLAIDCGASHVAAGIFAGGGKSGFTLERLSLERLDADPGVGDLSPWLAQLERSVAALVSELRFSGSCILAMPGHITLTRFLHAASMGKEPAAEAASLEAQQSIPCPLEQVVWDHLVLADDGMDREVLLAAAKVETIGAIHAAVAGAGLEVERILPASLTLVSAWRESASAEEIAIVADVGARSTNLAFVGTRDFFVRTLPFGGNLVTQFLGADLGIDFPAAEQVKRQLCGSDWFGGSDQPERECLDRAASRFADRFQAEVHRTLAGCRRSRPIADPARIVLAGGGSLLPMIPALLSKSLARPVERLNPLENLNRGTHFELPSPTEVTVFASLVGLAAQEFERSTPIPTLLPSEQARRLTRKRRRPALAAALGCAVIAPIPLIGYQRHAWQVAEREISEIGGRLAPLRQLAEEGEPALKLVGSMRMEAGRLRRLLNARTSWMTFLADLQSRFADVENVWLDRMQLLAASSGARVPAGALRLGVEGRLLDTASPGTMPGPESFRAADRLFRSLATSPFVEAIENEQFDNGNPGILRFGCVLRLKGETL